MSSEHPLSAAEQAILRTVLYSSLFEYPLTLDELRRNLLEISMEAPVLLAVYQSSAALHSIIEFNGEYFYPKGRTDMTALRAARESLSRKALEQNRSLLKLMALIPCTRLLAVSGSAAHLNMAPGADIDLFVVTRGARVWSVAVAMLLLTRLLGRRRRFCFNFLLADTRLKLEREDVFTASQIVHLKPLLGPDYFRRFLEANPFVSRTYPNFRIDAAADSFTPGALAGAFKTALEWLFRLGPAAAFEVICRAVYGRYLRSKSALWTTPEEVVLEVDFLKLHTRSHRKEVLKLFEEALEGAIRRLP